MSKKALKLSEEREKKKDELLTVKNEYKEGFWNANSVLMGGLGLDPEIEDEECSTKISKTETQTDVTGPKAIKSRTLQVTRRNKSRMQDHEDGTGMKTRNSEIGTSRQTPYTQTNTRVTTSTKKTKGNMTERSGEPTAQDRLERVWMQLQMPDGAKLDMAIKYSSDQYHNKLEQAIDRWERATELILQREQQVAKLENFERLASDPNRFFEKGFRGSSVARLQEAKIRSGYYNKIDHIDVELKKVLEDIRSSYQDIVTFQGRPYADKMSWDKTEMLYWLQEERKQQALDYEARLKHGTPQFQLKLDPISPNMAASPAVQ